jgi:hypothetical protein
LLDGFAANYIVSRDYKKKEHVESVVHELHYMAVACDGVHPATVSIGGKRHLGFDAAQVSRVPQRARKEVKYGGKEPNDEAMPGLRSFSEQTIPGAV